MYKYDNMIVVRHSDSEEPLDPFFVNFPSLWKTHKKREKKSIWVGRAKEGIVFV